MSTNDVPGHDPANNDKLAMGCWAEHKDGSLIFVESTEGNRVVYSIFDTAKEPIVAYRDAMPEINFKRQFSWDPSDKSKDRWTWHDKTPFDWDRVIRKGATDGPYYASADGLKTAAQRVADSLQLRARELDVDRYSNMQDQELARTGAIFSKLTKAINDLPTMVADAVKSAIGSPNSRKKKR